MIYNIFASVIEQNGVIVHQVNMKGVMGSGLAKQVRTHYPLAYVDYINNYRHSSLGDVIFTKINNIHIASVFGQDKYGKTGLYTKYEFLFDGLKKVFEYAEQNSVNVFIPYGIGCGLGGGDWNIVKEAIYDIFKNFSEDVYICQIT